MKKVVIVPIKAQSERVVGKNFRIVNDKPLYRFLLDKLPETNFDEIYIDSDSDEIKEYCKKMGFFFIERKLELTSKSANGNDLLNYHHQLIESDLYFQMFVTSPLLTTESMNNCIQLLESSIEHDSIMTVKFLHTWFWFKGSPVNYDPKALPRSQDSNPIVMETTGLYGITDHSLRLHKARVGSNPYFFEVSNFESVDIDDEFDFNYLNFLLNHPDFDFDSER